MPMVHELPPKLLAAIKGIAIGSLTISLLLISFFLSAYDTGFYEKFVQKNLENEKKIDERVSLHKEIIGFLKGSTPNVSSALDAKEKPHMEDVKRIFYWIQVALNILLSLGIITALIVSFMAKKKSREMGAILLAGGIIALLSMLLFAAFLWLDFGSLFDTMHQFLFANGTWVFPMDSTLIQLYPQDFFESIGFLIARSIFFIANIFIGAGIYARFISGGRHDKRNSRIC